jgi:hypothetical protein
VELLDRLDREQKEKRRQMCCASSEEILTYIPDESDEERDAIEKVMALVDASQGMTKSKPIIIDDTSASPPDHFSLSPSHADRIGRSQEAHLYQRELTTIHNSFQLQPAGPRSMPTDVLLALHEAGIDNTANDDAADIQLASFNLILRAATPVLRRCFLLRWRVAHDSPWCDAPASGAALLAANPPLAGASGDAVRAAIAAGDSARWDITTLAHALLRPHDQSLLPYASHPRGGASDRELVRAIVNWRNSVCHAAAPAGEARAAAAAAARHIAELARRYSAAAAAGPGGGAGW